MADKAQKHVPPTPEQQAAQAAIAKQFAEEHEPPGAPDGWTPPLMAAAVAPVKPKSVQQLADAIAAPTALKYAFLGSGQGGGRIASAFHGEGYRRIGVFNTTDADFQGIPADIKRCALDSGGAFKDASVAASLLASHQGDVWDLLTKAWGPSFDRAFICASLGGGTGSGTVAPLVETARKYMTAKGLVPKVGAIVSLPRVQEGQTQAKNAVEAFKRLLDVKASPIVIVDNGRIDKIYQPSFLNLYSVANKAVAQLFHKFNVLAGTKDAHTTFDQAELGQLLDGGILVMSGTTIPIASVETPADVAVVIRQSLSATLLAQVKLQSGCKGACLFVAPSSVFDRFSVDYFDAGYVAFQQSLGGKKGEAVGHHGAFIDETASADALLCYVMIAELEPPLKLLGELADAGGMSLGKEGINGYLGV